MQKHPFQIALTAIILGLLIPSVILMFGAVRSRQLTSKANPRWAQFAKVTGEAAAETDQPESSRLPVRTASISTDQVSNHTHSSSSSADTDDLTGSISGHRVIEVPVRSERTREQISDHHDAPPTNVKPHVAEERVSQHQPIVQQPIIFRAIEEDSETDIHSLDCIRRSRRLESRIIEIRQRLDRLAQQQEQFEANDIQRDLQVIELLQKLNETMQTKSRVDKARYDEIVTGQVPMDQVPVDPPKIAEIPPPKPVAAPVELPAEPPYEPEAAHSNVADQKGSSPAEHIPELKSSVTPPPVVDVPVVESIRITRLPRSSEVFTMEARHADVREFLLKLSDAAGVSILVSPEITGQISLNLREASFESALKAIAKSRHYVVENDSGVVVITTSEEAARLKRQNRQLLLRVYQPSYLSAAQLERLIEPLLSTDGRHSVSRNSKASSNDLPGEVEIEQRETVVVQDTAEVLAQIDQILMDMDIPPLQVEIEATILCVGLSGKLEKGIDLRTLPCQRNCCVNSGDDGLKQACLSSNVSGFIKSIEGMASTNVVTSQRIRVMNKHRAELLIGDKVGIQSKVGGPIRFSESGTRLLVRPTISADGCIRMEINPEQGLARQTRRSKVVHQEMAGLTTHVLVRDGATVAVGGLISEQVTDGKDRKSLIAPFRHHHDKAQRIEMIVLLTPHIITEP